MGRWTWEISIPYPVPFSPGWWDSLPPGAYPPAVYGAGWGPRVHLLAALRREARRGALGDPRGPAEIALLGARREARRRRAPIPLADGLAALWGFCRLVGAPSSVSPLPLEGRPLEESETQRMISWIHRLVWAWRPDLPPPGWARRRLALLAYQGHRLPVPAWDGETATLPHHWRAWMELLGGPLEVEGARAVLLDDSGLLLLWPEEEPLALLEDLHRQGYRAGTFLPAPGGIHVRLREKEGTP